MIMMEAHTDEERERAQHEVAVLRGLDHPGIIRYHEHFVHEDQLCVVMHLCEGGDLSQHIKQRAKHEKQFQEHEVIDLFVQIVMALHYVHSKRILHRDLKTQNIFVSRGRNGTMGLVKLGDFGIAKVLEGSYAAASTIIGTPYYMSPEVCQGQSYGYMSDVWALGCILYEVCALQQAWNGSNLLGLVYKIVQEKFPPYAFIGSITPLVRSPCARMLLLPLLD
jgi:NIMA (never in mitosis gene a)-related kinase